MINTNFYQNFAKLKSQPKQWFSFQLIINLEIFNQKCKHISPEISIVDVITLFHVSFDV